MAKSPATGNAGETVCATTLHQQVAQVHGTGVQPDETCHGPLGNSGSNYWSRWSETDSPRSGTAGLRRHEKHFDRPTMRGKNDLLIFGQIGVADDSLFRPQQRDLIGFFHVRPQIRVPPSADHRSSRALSDDAPERAEPAEASRQRSGSEAELQHPWGE